MRLGGIENDCKCLERAILSARSASQDPSPYFLWEMKKKISQNVILLVD